jgi:pimeloyl-ACP methyl ester carboxylesterase
MRPYPVLAALTLTLLATGPATAEAACDPDGIQASGSKYRICMPEPGSYNGMLVIWAHGFQDAGTPVAIPEDQLCSNDFCLSDLVNGLGFGFATNSYRKTGLAIVEGKEDILDLVAIYTQQKGVPSKVYLVGASEGGIITALALEQHPDVFSAGVAACGPVGDFPAQINYFGDARVTFDYFFPGLIPGDPFNPDPELVETWLDFYATDVAPVVFAPANAAKLQQWVAVAKLPFDASDPAGSLAISVADALRYPVVNILDATATIGGFPFDNRSRWYSGSQNDLLLNLTVKRIGADPAAVQTMQGPGYATTGALTRPLVTLHTTLDQQVPQWHQVLYSWKTLFKGTFLTRHFPITVNRFEHCNFTRDDALFSFVVMLFYDAAVQDVSGTASYLNPAQLARFEQRAAAIGLPTRRSGSGLAVTLRK